MELPIDEHWEYQERRLYLICLIRGDSRFENLGIVAVTATPRGVRLLFGPPNYYVVNITSAGDAWELYSPFPARYLKRNIPDDKLVTAIGSLSAMWIAWARLAVMYRAHVQSNAPRETKPPTLFRVK